MMRNKNGVGILLPLVMCSGMAFSSVALADGHCVSYAAATEGGEGGFRITDNNDSFRKISGNGRIEGNICNRDSVRIELSKRDINTKVGMKIGEKRYQFPAGDKGDKRANDWYRKYFTIKLK